MWSLLFAICVAFFTTTSVAQCPDDFVKLGGACYNAFHIQASWAEAELWCRQFNTELASVENEEEQKYLTNFLSRLSKAAFSPGEFWVGGSNLLTNTWMSSEMRPLVYTHWSPGQPSNNTQHRCMAMGFSSNFLWYAGVCNKKNNFICKTYGASGDLVIG